MWRFLKTRGVEIAALIVALTVLNTAPAQALVQLPGPAAGGIAGAAIIGAIIVAKIWRQR